MSNTNIIEQITPNDALAIIKMLAKVDENIKSKIEQIAKELFCDIDINDIAEEVFCEIDSLYVEDLWDSSGGTSYGYVEPHERAFEMIEETIEPFINEMKKYKQTEMFQEEKVYCMGILKGIYKYEKEAESEFKDWATDVPGESFTHVLNEWKNGKKDSDDILEMEEFVKNNFAGWR